MSMSTLVESFDTPMADYSEDIDVPMIVSTENWYNSSITHMEEDAILGENVDSLEVDMMAYDETTEYEMRDDTEAAQEVATEVTVVDTEVPDVTFDSSPLPPPIPELEHQGEPVAVILESNQMGADYSLDKGESSVPQQSEEAALEHFDPQQTTFHDQIDVSASGLQEHAISHETTELGTVEIPKHVNDSTELIHTVSSNSEASAVHEVEHGNQHVHVEEQASNDAQNAVVDEVEPTHEVHLVENPDDQHESTEVEAHNDQPEFSHPVNGNEEDEVDSSVHPDINQSTFSFHPPPISLTLQVTSSEGAQPDFMLFGAPDSGPSDNTHEEPLILLQHHTSLFFEPISTVFDAFRQEEYFSHIEELSEAEMALNAFDLQLVISEDNIYAREVSLHDLYAMHQGVGLPGHLRLILQPVVPRFIARYNFLRDQITRLTLDDETEHQTHTLDALEEVQDENAQEQEVAEHNDEPKHDDDDVPKQDEEEHKQDEEEHKHDEQYQEFTGEDEAQVYDESEHDFTGTGTGEEQAQDFPEPEHGSEEVEEESYEQEPDQTEKGQDNSGLANDDDANQVGNNSVLEEEPAGEEAQNDVAYDAPEVEQEQEEQEEEEEEEEISTEYVDIVEPSDGDGQDFSEDTDNVEDVGDEENLVYPIEGAGVESNSLSIEKKEEGREGFSVPVENEASFDVPPHTGDILKASEDEIDKSTLPDTENHADHSMQSLLAGSPGYEGNVDDEDGFGDEDFGDDEFDETEDTLEDPTEEEQGEELTEKTDIADSYDSAISNLDTCDDVTQSLEDQPTNVPPDNFYDPTNDHDENSAVGEYHSIHKKPSKRSLDDADLSDHEQDLQPISPDSKRVRTK